MSEEERQKLCEIFRDNTTTIYPHHLKEAAEEIERLAAEVERPTTIMFGNVHLVEELDDGAIFEISPTPPKS